MKYLYFPSFSAGSYFRSVELNETLRNGLPVRFFDKNFPEPWRHPYFLVTAGHYYKQENFREKIGFGDTLLMGDSGGYQIASGVLKWDKSLLIKIFNWLENNSDIAVNLDIPPRMTYQGKDAECLELSISNFKYFANNQTGKTKFLNVLQGSDEYSFNNWYNSVKQFNDFSGWAIGGLKTIYNFMTALKTLLQDKAHLNPKTEYIHILGVTKITDFFILSQIQYSLDKLGLNIKVTTDSSTPARSTVFGLYRYGAKLRDGVFECIHIPSERSETNRQLTKYAKSTISGLDSFTLPKVIEFDDLLLGGYTYDDIKDWTATGFSTIVLHNLMMFKTIMSQIDSFVRGPEYFLEQVASPNMFKILRSVDEMICAHVNGTEPKIVFEKYKPLYLKMSSERSHEDISADYF